MFPVLVYIRLSFIFWLASSDFNAFFTVFRDKPSFSAIFLVPILGFRFFQVLIVIQSSIEITSKPPAINQEYFSKLGGSIFDGKKWVNFRWESSDNHKSFHYQTYLSVFLITLSDSFCLAVFFHLYPIGTPKGVSNFFINSFTYLSLHV